MPLLLYNLLIAGGKIIVFLKFQRVLALCEIQKTTHIYIFIYIYIYICVCGCVCV